MRYLTEVRATRTVRSCTDLIVTFNFQNHMKIKISKYFSKFLPHYAPYKELTIQMAKNSVPD